MPRRLRPSSVFVLAASLLASAPLHAAFAGGPIALDVDLAAAPSRIFRARLAIPVTPGPLTLVYPKWIPGEHGPTGPISDLVGLELRAGDELLRWQRDPADMFALQVIVPPGAAALEVRLDYLSPPASGTFSASPAATARLAVLSWNTVVLYPAGAKSDDLVYRPSLRLPAGWRSATALEEAARDGERIDYAPVSLTTLVDSPVLAGRHFATIDLGEALGARHELAIAAESEAALAISSSTTAGLRQLVAETTHLFAARHYRRYRFLLSLSDELSSFGLEHHESSDDRLGERALIDEKLFADAADLFAHEMVHSWNGKHRRPAGLATPDYQTPMVGDLLWVYEGLTTYLGAVLTARSGLRSRNEALDDLAWAASRMASRRGRAWRPLADTARAAQTLYGTRPEGRSWRRGVDFYDEGTLLWLEVDARIRALEPGRSLDDFCRRFAGGESGPPGVVPYSRGEIAATLGAVAREDWDAFFTERVDRLRASPLGGLEAAGWRLVYTSEPNVAIEAAQEGSHNLDLTDSLGLTLHEKDDAARILDVLPGSPADAAGLAGGMRVIAVDGRRWSADRLKEAIEEAKGGGGFDLLIENADRFATVHVDADGGLRYPHLERIEGTPDLLSEILARRAPAVD